MFPALPPLIRVARFAILRDVIGKDCGCALICSPIASYRHSLELNPKNANATARLAVLMANQPAAATPARAYVLRKIAQSL
jgi:hypothetical protein